MNVAQAVLFIATTCGVATLVEDAVKPQVPSKKLDEFVEKAFGVRGWPEYSVCDHESWETIRVNYDGMLHHSSPRT